MPRSFCHDLVRLEREHPPSEGTDRLVGHQELALAGMPFACVMNEDSAALLSCKDLFHDVISTQDLRRSKHVDAGCSQQLPLLIDDPDIALARRRQPAAD